MSIGGRELFGRPAPLSQLAQPITAAKSIDRERPVPHRSEPVARLDALDGLRAVAVLLVFFDHSTDGLSGGFIGVELFFVISGYLITSLLLRETLANGRPDIRRFCARRALRILPALVVCVLTVFLFAPWIIEEPGSSAWDNAQAALLGYMNLRRADGATGGALGHTWSLSLEEQFYLVWVLVVWTFVASRRQAWLAGAVVLAIVAVCFWRLGLALGGATPERLYNGFSTRVDAILYGCLLAVLPQGDWRGWLARSWPLPVLVLLALLPTVGWDSPLLPRGGFTVIALACTWVLVATLEARGLLKHVLEHRVAVWLGRRSYSFYLWHFPVILGAGAALPRSLDHIWVKLVVTLALAELSYRAVEMPFLRLRHRVVERQPDGRGVTALRD